MILNSILECQSSQIELKESAKENWEVLRTFYVGMDRVVHAMMQALKRNERWMITQIDLLKLPPV